MVGEHVLSGLKVLDLTRALAGPSCTRMLAEMGAEVIKVEAAPDGDMTRRLSCFKNNRSLYFIQQNRNKKSLCLDLRSSEGLDIVRALVPQVDVVVENFKPGVIRDMGLGYEDLTALRDDIILCSISAFGQSGPLAFNPGYDYIAQAYAGVTSMIGETDDAPCIPLVGLGDVSTGVHAALAITSALLYRARSGHGQHLDVSLLDVYYSFHEVNVHQYVGSEGQIEPTRGGRHMSYVSPAGIYAARDGYVLIMAFMQHWQDLCAAMERPDLLDHPVFGEDHSRTEHRMELVPIIEDWLASFDGVASAVAKLNQHGVPCAPVLSVAETVDHPHLVARGTVQTMHDPLAGTFRAPAMPLRFSAFPEQADYRAPTLGQHNEEILRGMLDKSVAEVTDLEQRNIVQSKNC